MARADANVPSLEPSSTTITLLLPVEAKPEWRFGDFVNLKLLSLANAGLIVSRDKLTDPEFKLISGPQRPWSSLTRDEKIKTNLKANFDGKKPLYLYQNPGALPRAFTLDKLHLFDSDREVLNAMGKASLEELAHTGYINKSDLPAGFDPSIQLATKSVTISRYSGDQIIVDFAPSNSPTILLVSNTFSPYWKSFIDDVETQIFPLDHTFWGLMIPASARQVIFNYRAPYRG